MCRKILVPDDQEPAGDFLLEAPKVFVGEPPVVLMCSWDRRASAATSSTGHPSGFEPVLRNESQCLAADEWPQSEAPARPIDEDGVATSRRTRDRIGHTADASPRRSALPDPTGAQSQEDLPPRRARRSCSAFRGGMGTSLSGILICLRPRIEAALVQYSVSCCTCRVCSTCLPSVHPQMRFCSALEPADLVDRMTTQVGLSLTVIAVSRI